ncbi:expressed unknown protein [Seminavis robusta]|uniref:Uncharacterized protein n=1 Tax=Seminavis robusta TaxID=568900 RepID=A0A9N8D649_9STRA|nr:expressed unknown protein [Seminavis robusta]|eukprot:Sro14_g010610.1 n/a (369) ;mRNA; f:95033-96139
MLLQPWLGTEEATTLPNPLPQRALIAFPHPACNSSEGSMDLRKPVPVEERFQGKPRSPEKVMDKSRQIKKVDGVPGVGTDDTESIDQTFAAGIKKKIMLLEIDCWNVETGEDAPYLGQVAVLRNPQTGTRKFVTCKRNMTTDENDKGEIEECHSPHKCVLANGRSAQIILPNTGRKKMPGDAISLRKGIVWSNGFDISLGPAIDLQTGTENWPNDPVRSRRLNELISQLGSFDLVDEKFLYEEDLKIGIVTYKPGAGEEDFSEVGGLEEGIPIWYSWANAVKGFIATKIGVVLGEKDDLMIYTGSITEVGNDHIEYNVNTFKGCSGAVVIVMDRSHPDFGKAMAIHAGYQPALGTNLGFKLAGNFDRP